MAARARFSIAVLMAVVFFVATDFAIVKAIWESSDPYDVIATEHSFGWLALVLKILRRDAHTGEGKEAVARSCCEVAIEDNVLEL